MDRSALLFLPQWTPSSSKSGPKLHQQVVHARSHAAKVAHDRRRAKGKKGSEKVDQVEEPDGWLQKTPVLEYSSLRGLRTDPFNCIPSDNPALVYEAVDYFMQVIVPNSVPTYDIFNVTPEINSLLVEMMQHSDLQYSAITLLQICMSASRNPDGAFSPKIYEYHGRAIATLRRRLAKLQSTNDNVTIMTAAILGSLARSLNNTESFESHRKALQLMVHGRGGLDALGSDGLLKAWLLHWDSSWALNTNSSMFPEREDAWASVYPEYPLSGDNLKLLYTLPEGFRKLGSYGDISVQTLLVLSRATLVNAVYRKKGYFAAQTTTNIFRSKQGRFSEYAEACPCLVAPDVKGRPSLEKLIVLALLLYCSTTFITSQVAIASAIEPRTKLTNTLAKVEVKLEEEKECLIWIWLVLVDSWRDSAGTLAPAGEVLWWKLRLNLLRDKSYDETARLLEKFLCNASLLKNIKRDWEDVWGVE